MLQEEEQASTEEEGEVMQDNLARARVLQEEEQASTDREGGDCFLWGLGQD